MDTQQLIPVFVRAASVVTPMGTDLKQVVNDIMAGKSQVGVHNRSDLDDSIVYASLFPDTWNADIVTRSSLSRFEYLAAEALHAVCPKDHLFKKEGGMILASTKGNIGDLEYVMNNDADLISMRIDQSAQKIANALEFQGLPIVISNACISGLSAILYGTRMIRSGKWQHAWIVGADCISGFIYQGFKSFQALSRGYCRPFSDDRDGINLGEAAAALWLSASPDPKTNEQIVILDGTITNDANHISGPSRTGAELGFAMTDAIHRSGIHPDHLAFINAHGTATPFNDLMEANAIVAANLKKLPVFSLKGIFGHTLGAAGILETVICIEALKRNMILPCTGYSGNPVAPDIKVSDKPLHNIPMSSFIKTGSGFGGCNAAVVIEKRLKD